MRNAIPNATLSPPECLYIKMAEQNGDDSQALYLKVTEMGVPGQVGSTDSSSRVCRHVTEPRFSDSARLGHSIF